MGSEEICKLFWSITGLPDDGPQNERIQVFVSVDRNGHPQHLVLGLLEQMHMASLLTLDLETGFQ